MSSFYRGKQLGLKEAPPSWRDKYFEGRKPKAYRRPTAKQIADDEMRGCVATVEAAKIAIAGRPDRRGQEAHGLRMPIVDANG